VKYLLDTDHLSILERKPGPDYAVLAARIGSHPPSDLTVSVVSFHVQALGCHSFISRARTAAEVIRGYGMFSRLLTAYSTGTVLSFDSAAAAVFDGLVASRVRIGTMDLRIASIALARGLILLTRNITHFSRMPGLVMENWTK
jgi:tRNA(fMet)-specific endonuclease VapC